MSMELINLSGETKSYLNNLTKAIESLAKTKKERFFEVPYRNGKAFVKAESVAAVTVTEHIEGHKDVSLILENGRILLVTDMSYEDVCRRLTGEVNVKRGDE